MNEIIRRAAWLALATLLALTLWAAPAVARQATTAQERLDALVERMRTTTNEFFEKNWKDDLSEEQQAELYAKRPGLEFVPQFEALALETKGSDVAALARMQVLSIQCDFAKSQEAQTTLARLLEESMPSMALKNLPPTLMYSFTQMEGPERAPALREHVLRTLETILEKSPHKEVKASVLFSQGQMYCSEKSSDEQRAKGRKCFERLIAEFGDVKGNRKLYKVAAEAFLFELDHLQIGMVAPDFETIDENGTKFKLSDYRGKVVVIDYWGNW